MAYTNSPLVKYVKISHNQSGKRLFSITRITPHCVVGQLSLETLGDVFSGKRQVSSNYGIDPDGRVGMYVEEKDRSWCSSDWDNDNRGITIEVASDSYHPYAMTDKAYNGLVELCADICYRNGKKKLLWFGDKAKTLGYTPASDEMVLTVHRWFDTKACPGDWLYSRLGNLAKSVTTKLGGGYIPRGTFNQALLSSSGEVIDDTEMPGITIDHTQLNPYLVELDDKSPISKWDKLKENRFVGAMIYAGALYNKSHKKLSTFRGTKTYEHVKAAIDAGVPFGYYMPLRAKNTIEADEEMYELSFLVRKYPPKLGVWVGLEFLADKAFNDNMLKAYQKELVRLGLKNKIGIRGPKSMLDKISWKKFQDDWTFWLNDKVSKFEELDQLLTPEFFDTDGKSG